MTTATRTYIDPPAAVGTERYWDAARNGKLMIMQCNGCGEAYHYPRPLCPHCFSEDTEWLETAGTGVIYSYSVMRRADPPFAIGYVTLDEGPTLMTNFVDCDFEALAIGQPVRLAFVDTEGGYRLPVFTLA